MDQLPLEIIENILRSPRLTVQDVVNFSLTCSYFRHSVVNSTAIWKQKFRDKWPHLVDLFDKNYTEYFNEVQYVYTLKERTRYLLEAMPARFYKKYELSDVDLEEWGTLMRERQQNYYYLVIDLMEIVNTNVPIKSIEAVPLNIPGNKTLQYYASKVLRYIRQLHLSSEWIEYMNLPERQQILERGAIFVAQWCQPNKEVSYREIAAKLDHISNLVKRRLKVLNPSHQLFKASEKDLARWRIENFDRNQWNVPECREVIVAMRDVIYTELGFSGNNTSYYIPENSLINEVLESRKGLPITLAVVYEAIGRRLGLLLEPISFPAHFLLRFTESDLPDAPWYYIDIFNAGNIVRKSACPHSRFVPQKTLFPVATAAQVVERMANNLELSTRQYAQPNGRVTRLRSILELLKLVSPQDLAALVSLAKLYMLHNMNTRSLEHYLTTQHFNAPEQAQRILHMLKDFAGHHEQDESDILNQVEVAQRTGNLRFAVGMVMTHSTLNYKCVIYDWDPMCLATVEWQAEMAVNKLALKNEQPFYNVLVEDGSHRYVAQENLEPTSELGILYLNEDLGRHFSHFFETHYVPNAEKEKEYPEDQKVRHKFYHQMLLANYKP